MGLPQEPCGARLSNGRGRCRAHPAKRRLRCRFHGGASTGPRTIEGKQRTIAAMVAGRRRWLERMQRAKALGLVDKIPTGRRRPKVRAAPSKAVARARGIAFRNINARPQSAQAKGPEDESVAGLMADAFREALLLLLAILDLPAGDNVQLARLQMRTSLDLLKLTIR